MLNSRHPLLDWSIQMISTGVNPCSSLAFSLSAYIPSCWVSNPPAEVGMSFAQPHCMIGKLTAVLSFREWKLAPICILHKELFATFAPQKPISSHSFPIPNPGPGTPTPLSSSFISMYHFDFLFLFAFEPDFVSFLLILLSITAMILESKR